MPQYEVLHNEVAPEGEYSFRVTNAEEKQSKAGNAMIELELQVDVPGKNGGIKVWDRLVFAKDSTWKVDDFRRSTGEKLVEGPGSFEAEDCVDRFGRLRLTVEEYEGRSRNRVGQYLDPNAEKTAESPSKKVDPPSLLEQLGDDEMPM
jgi:uncharacterized protein DUF669